MRFFSKVISRMQKADRRGSSTDLTSPLDVELAFPKFWLSNIKKFSVREDICYTGGRVLIVVKIYYRSWWKPRRKIVFIQKERTSVETDPHRNARMLIDKLKSITSSLENDGLEGQRPSSSYRRMVKLAA